ncbi:hypothetical protein ASD53_09635 [Lysobacter sp. Root559]|nr:hypothetical protein ASD53_09635 [Lysobacter sp. Root559]KRC34005.1 hypothetical protein ASE10_13820 [Lysobacter sp. Root76]KRD69339.1 hypothetical protein ASE45_09260 [Lysobacter sp. Root96]
MHAEIESWNNGWHGISLGLTVAEIDRLIALLTKLKSGPDQHFHMSSDYSGSGGIGDIEVYVASAEELSNLQLSGLAIAPGSEFPPAGP